MQADVKLIELILHAPEQKTGKALGEKNIVNKGSVSLITGKQLAYLTTGVHSYELIKEELNWLITLNPPTPCATFKLLNKLADFD